MSIGAPLALLRLTCAGLVRPVVFQNGDGELYRVEL